MMYRYTIKQCYSFCEKMHHIKLYCIYFKSAMFFVTIPLVDAATLFCLEVKAEKETKELFIISIIFKIIFDCFKIWTICRGLVLFWPITLIAFSQLLSKLRYQMSSQTHCFEKFKAKVVSTIDPPEKNANSKYMQYKQFF